MKKRSILSVLLFLVALLALTSCEGLFGPKPDPNEETGKTNPKSFTQIVYSDPELDLFDVSTKMRSIVGPTVKIGLASEVEPSDGEVVFGESDRAVTVKAKAELEKLLDGEENYDCGYIIYCDGKNIAVYWQEPEMSTIAISEFVNVALDEQGLELDSGALAYKFYSKRDFDSEKYWLAVSSKTTSDVVAALKRLYKYYDGPKLIAWMANLYDPERGGFYYSRDARDYEPFRPDLESTSFILGAIKNNKAIENYTDLPEEIRRDILEFVWSTQSKEDGYFYHPQWAQSKDELNTDRYGRDISWATTIIRNLDLDTNNDGVYEDQYPLYCAPNGTKCAEHNGTDDTCSFPVSTAYYASSFGSEVTTALSSSVSSAVSRVYDSYVSPTASLYRPDYSSAAAFKAWLLAYNADIKVNSGKAHNLAALIGEITNKGYAGIVYQHLYDVQKEVLEEQLADGETPTGLWQKTVDYTAVWGLLKYSGFFTNGDFGGPFYEECVPYAAKTCIEVIQMEADGNYHMNDLYNMWTGLSNLISIVRSRNNNPELVQQIYDIVRKDAAGLIDATIMRMDGFKQTDGSFSYNSDGTTQPKVYGTNVCFGGREGDVNAVHLCLNMYNSIYNCLGLPLVPIFSYDDGQEFIRILLESEKINKKKQDIATIDYETQAYKTSILQSLKSSGAKVSDTDDPVSAGNRVLELITNPGAGDYVYITPVGYGTTCYLFETDIFISSESSNSQLYQISFGGSDNGLFMLELTKDGGSVKIEVDQNKNSGAGEHLLGSFATDTWTKLRVECYVAGEENGIDVPHLKLWIGEDLVGVSTNYIGYGVSEPKGTTYSTLEIYSLMSAKAITYLDNTFASREEKTFDEFDSLISDSRD